jgi:hypothetical protein
MNSWPTTRDELSAAYEDFQSRYGKAHAVTEMARAYGIARRTTYARLAAAGLRETRPRVRRPSPDELRKVYPALIAQHGERWAIGQLAAQHGVNYVSARKWLIEDGLHTVTPQTPRRPITEPCPCGAKATTRYRDQDPALCFRCYMRAYVADNDSGYRRFAREYIAELKRITPCADCGQEYPPCCMHFDHVPERGPKLFNVANCDRAMADVKAEIEKCDIVCANCHAIRTWVTREKPWIKRTEAVRLGLPAVDGALF